MAVAAPRSFFSSRFFVVLISLALVLAALGGSVFRYLTASAQIAVGQSRSIAIATTFVPATSPFSLSLLSTPESLLALSQSGLPDDQIIAEGQQLRQSLSALIGLDYERDVLPWLGGEMTFALTDMDLDADAANGEQPGYLLAIAIAPNRQLEAREALRLLWQRRSLSGDVPRSERVSGVRLLYSAQLESKGVGAAASALVGDRFVLFANDARVLRRSIRAAQSTTNLAQNRAYRETVAQLPDERVGLAYFEPSRMAMSLELSSGGVVARLRQAQRVGLSAKRFVNEDISLGADEISRTMAFLPAESQWAIASADLSERSSALSALGVAEKDLPSFMASAADGFYALGRVNAGWILIIERDEEKVAAQDAAALEKGYSAVPVALGEDEAAENDLKESGAANEAIAWTRFKAKSRSRTTSSGLQTEVLGLHMPLGNYEIFTDTLGAMEQAMAASKESPNRALSQSLSQSSQFKQAASVLPQPNGGYLYLSGDTAASLLQRQSSQVQRTARALDPLLSRVRSSSVAVGTDEQDSLSVFIQMSR